MIDDLKYKDIKYILYIGQNEYTFVNDLEVHSLLKLMFNFTEHRQTLYAELGSYLSNNYVELLKIRHDGQVEYLLAAIHRSLKFLLEEYGDTYDPEMKYLNI